MSYSPFDDQPEFHESIAGNETPTPQSQDHVSTQKNLSESSLQELRVKVAELCGATWGHPVYGHDSKWHVHLGNPPFEFDSSWAGKPPAFDCCWKDIDVPDYCNDLNAMHEAEKMLTPEQQQNYSAQLQPVGGSDDIICWDLITATAEQRCRAFILCHSQKESQ